MNLPSIPKCGECRLILAFSFLLLTISVITGLVVNDVIGAVLVSMCLALNIVILCFHHP